MKAVKTLLILSVACLLSTVSVLAQGRINFNNNSTSRLYIGNPVPPNNFTILGTASTATFGIGPASVRIQLFAGLTSTSLSPVLIGTAADQLYVTNTASQIPVTQGLFVGGGNLVLPGFDGSAPVFLQMTFQSIDNLLYFGQSSIIQVIPATGSDLATSVFGPLGAPNAWDNADPWDGISRLTIAVAVPEPSALALTGLSFAVMFFARRKMRGIPLIF